MCALDHGRSVGWSVGRLVGRSGGRSVGRSVGRLVGRSVVSAISKRDPYFFGAVKIGNSHPLVVETQDLCASSTFPSLSLQHVHGRATLLVASCCTTRVIGSMGGPAHRCSWLPFVLLPRRRIARNRGALETCARLDCFTILNLLTCTESPASIVWHTFPWGYSCLMVGSPLSRLCSTPTCSERTDHLLSHTQRLDTFRSQLNLESRRVPRFKVA